MEHPDEIDSLLTSRNSLVADLSGSRIFLLRDNLPERPAAANGEVRDVAPAEIQ